MKNTTVLILVIFLVIVCLLFCVKQGKERYEPEKTYGFPYYFQNLPPSLDLENRYHTCIVDNCGADYNNAECLQRCYILSMKNGTTDKADLICFDKKDNAADYLDCMDGVYHNYKNLDRSMGVSTCKCPNGSTSYMSSEGVCVCHETKPLNVRFPTDKHGHIKPYSIY